MLQDLLEKKILTKNKICISEILPQNVDFLILEILQIVKNKSLFSFNEHVEHYRSILNRRSIQSNVVVESTYSNNEFIMDKGEVEKFSIVDDIYTGIHLSDTKIQPWISIYRSSSIKKIDYYNYDVIIQVEPLRSGCSTEYDGIINIFNREGNIRRLRYKIKEEKTMYYDF